VAVLLILWLLIGFAGLQIGQSKNRAVEGALLGFFLGLIGLIVIACLSPKSQRAVLAPVMPLPPMTPPRSLAPESVEPATSNVWPAPGERG
jgi:hypothetical protein